MKRVTRNRGSSNRFEEAAKEVIREATKGGRKLKNLFESTSKSKKTFSYNNAIKNVINYSPSIKEKAFKASIGPSIYIINISII